MPLPPEFIQPPETSANLDTHHHRLAIWRQALELPPALPSDEQKAKQAADKLQAELERKQVLDNFAGLLDTEQGAIAKNREKIAMGQHTANLALETMPLRIKLERLITQGRLKHSGIKKEVMELVDQNLHDANYRTASYYFNLTRRAKEQLNTLNKLAKPKDTLNRANLLGITTLLYSLKGPAISQYLQQLEQIPEAVFGNFLKQLEQFHHGLNIDELAVIKDVEITEASHERIITPYMKQCLELAQSGGLAHDQLTKLTRLDKLNLMDGGFNNLETALKIEEDTIADRETVYSELFRRARPYRLFAQNVSALDRHQLFPALAKAIREGLTLGDKIIYSFGLVLKQDRVCPDNERNQEYFEEPARINDLKEALVSVPAYQENPQLKERIDTLREGLGATDLESLPMMISLAKTLTRIEQKAGSLTDDEKARLYYLLNQADEHYTPDIFNALFLSDIYKPLNFDFPLVQKVIAVVKTLLPVKPLVDRNCRLTSYYFRCKYAKEATRLFSEKFLPADQQTFWRTYSSSDDSIFSDWLIDSRKYIPEFISLLSTDAEGQCLYQLMANQNSQIDDKVDASLGERIFNLRFGNKITADEIIDRFCGSQAYRLFDSSQSTEDLNDIHINDDSWQSLLHLYIASQQNFLGRFAIAPVSDKAKEFLSTIKAIFDTKAAKNFCLEKLQKSWLNYLNLGNPKALPLSLLLTAEMVSAAEGAGPLSQIEALAMFIKSVNNSLLKSTTVERTGVELLTGLNLMEDKFKQENWSNEDKSNFYNISQDILNAAPSLYSEFLRVFNSFNPNDLKRFYRELYPLYQVKLVFLQNSENEFNPRDLVTFRHELRKFGSAEKDIKAERSRLLEDIKMDFQYKFGITKIPNEFKPEDMRSVTNMSLYNANMAGNTPDKESILSYYLALIINGQWSKFREGKSIDPSQLLSPDKVNVIKQFLEKRQANNPLTPAALNLKPKEIATFQSLLQDESQRIAIGNIETIDIKLANVISNLEGMLDEDLYPEKVDKEMLKLLITYGDKKIGSVSAKTFQQFSGRQSTLSEEELEIQQQIFAIISSNNLAKSREVIKEYFQDRIKPFSVVVNLLNSIKESQASEQLSQLKDLLRPNLEVIAIFNKLGEQFSPTSGAYALSQDLSYLENLVVKKENELTGNEKDVLSAYIGEIRSALGKMEAVYADIKQKFNNLRRANVSNPLLVSKIAEIDKIINREDTQQAINSTMTNNMNLVIENIRECLSCTHAGSNNDTNLTFGDSNKFFIFSQTQAYKEKGSLADQIVFVVPITRSDGQQEVSFVLDTVYGVRTPDILINHIQTTLAKYERIKKQFPDIKLSVLVSQSALRSSGISTSALVDNLRSSDARYKVEYQEHIVVNVNHSAAGDHYIEFGSNARTSGEKNTSGVLISI